MKFFDFFKKKKSDLPKVEVEQLQKKESDIKYSYTKNGFFTIHFYDDELDFAQSYDNTKLVVNTTPLNFANEDVYECNVVWYTDNNCSPYPSDELKLIDQQCVLIQFDLPLSRLDPEYAYILMKKILNKNNVIGHLEDGLKETPATPCGNYVGGIIVNDTTGEYQEYFSKEVGKAVHNSPKMVERREKYRNQFQEKASQLNYSSNPQMDAFSR